jgi:phage FluMu protein Com
MPQIAARARRLRSVIRRAATDSPTSSEDAGARSATGKPTTRSDNDVETLRCECGRLLARVLNAAVELKCARCKRVVIIVNGRRFEEAGAALCDCLESICRERCGG